MSDNNTARRVILNVPYKEKSEAKELGAWWDPEIKKWFVPQGKSAEPFTKWLPSDDEDSSIADDR